MWQKIKSLWSSNETILWARIQMLFGVLVTVIATTDPTIFHVYVPVQYLPLYIVASGLITELARRYKARDLG